MASSKKSSTPINNKIKALHVMLIDQDGLKQGLVSIKDALVKAGESSLDLVQVSPSDAYPVVCKLLDYGKHVFDKKKSLICIKGKS